MSSAFAHKPIHKTTTPAASTRNFAHAIRVSDGRVASAGAYFPAGTVQGGFYDDPAATTVRWANVVPAPGVAGGPDFTVPAALPSAAATLDGSASGCYFGPCSHKFSISCPGKADIVRQGVNKTTFTVGFSDSFDVNVRNTPAGANCTYSYAMTDAYSYTNTYSGTLKASLLLRSASKGQMSS